MNASWCIMPKDIAHGTKTPRLLEIDTRTIEWVKVEVGLAMCGTSVLLS